MTDANARDGDRRHAVGHEMLKAYPLVDALVRRRSRRFALGSRLHGSALSYASAADPVPLSHEEEAVLAFAGSGVTGHVYGELPFAPSAGPETGGGQVMMSLVGRTSSSADAVATANLCITRDDGTFLMLRPQQFAPDAFRELTDLAREHRY